MRSGDANRVDAPANSLLRDSLPASAGEQPLAERVPPDDHDVLGQEDRHECDEKRPGLDRRVDLERDREVHEHDDGEVFLSSCRYQIRQPLLRHNYY